MDMHEWATLQEQILKAQLKVIREFLGQSDEPKTRRKKSAIGSMSQIDMITDVLRDAGEPLHVFEIMRRVEERFHVRLDRESVVSSLTKKVKKEREFSRTGPNTFSLR